MSDHINKTIDDAVEELRKQEAAVLKTKELINHLCTFSKREPMFPNLENATDAAGRTTIRRNAFYGQPLARCVREFLEMRKTRGQGEASLDEIMAALKEGSFDLATISKDEDGQKRGVAISLAKNTSAFHRLPNGDFGILSWYPNIKAKKEKTTEAASIEKPDTYIDEAASEQPAPKADASML